MQHILLGVDHLLFVLGLLLIVSDRWTLVKTITSFTLAHSVTLAIATLGYASVPLPPLNAAIALSILFLGPEIVRTWRGESSFTIRHPWVVAFAFGLLHGFGFATGLTAMGLPQAEIPLALLLFNVGVELGQVAFVLLVILLERSFRVLEVHWPRLVAAPAGLRRGNARRLLDDPDERSCSWEARGEARETRGTGRCGGRRAASCRSAALCPSLAWAHTESARAAGLLAGLHHPVSGLDHVLAMVAVGLWGAQLGAPAVWLLPVTFPMVMALGGMLGLLGVPLPGVEFAIALSGILLGLAVLAEWRPPLWAAAVVVGFFAIFHGHAHGTELPAGRERPALQPRLRRRDGHAPRRRHRASASIHRWTWGRVTLRVAGALVAAAATVLPLEADRVNRRALVRGALLAVGTALLATPGARAPRQHRAGAVLRRRVALRTHRRRPGAGARARPPRRTERLARRALALFALPAAWLAGRTARPRLPDRRVGHRSSPPFRSSRSAASSPRKRA